jgi:hypothetical protein
MVFDDKLTLSIVVGGLFVIFGVYITNQNVPLPFDKITGK